jgi:hypothetical protein
VLGAAGAGATRTVRGDGAAATITLPGGAAAGSGLAA